MTAGLVLGGGQPVEDGCIFALAQGSGLFQVRKGTRLAALQACSASNQKPKRFLGSKSDSLVDIGQSIADASLANGKQTAESVGRAEVNFFLKNFV